MKSLRSFMQSCTQAKLCNSSMAVVCEGFIFACRALFEKSGDMFDTSKLDVGIESSERSLVQMAGDLQLKEEVQFVKEVGKGVVRGIEAALST